MQSQLGFALGGILMNGIQSFSGKPKVSRVLLVQTVGQSPHWQGTRVLSSWSRAGSGLGQWFGSDTVKWSPSKSTAARHVPGQARELSWWGWVRARIAGAGAWEWASLQHGGDAAQEGARAEASAKKQLPRGRRNGPLLLCFFTTALISGGANLGHSQLRSRRGCAQHPDKEVQFIHPHSETWFSPPSPNLLEQIAVRRELYLISVYYFPKSSAG